MFFYDRLKATFFKLLLINWRIIALQNFVVCCQTSTRQHFNECFDFFFLIIIYLLQVLVEALGIFDAHCSMWGLWLLHVESSSPTRDWTQAPSLGAQSLNHQRSPMNDILMKCFVKETPDLVIVADHVSS